MFFRPTLLTGNVGNVLGFGAVLGVENNYVVEKLSGTEMTSKTLSFVSCSPLTELWLSCYYALCHKRVRKVIFLGFRQKR